MAHYVFMIVFVLCCCYGAAIGKIRGTLLFIQWFCYGPVYGPNMVLLCHNMLLCYDPLCGPALVQSVVCYGSAIAHYVCFALLHYVVLVWSIQWSAIV